MNEKITIIIPTCGINFDKALKLCLDSLLSTTNFHSGNIKLHIVANGMNDLNSLVFAVNTSWNITVSVHKEPLGYVGAINEGLKDILSKNEKPDYILFLNDDTVIHSKDWLELLLNPFRQDPQMGLVGAKSLPDPSTGIDFPLGFCVLIKTELIEKIGMLDPIFGIGFNDDADFCIRALQAGYHSFSYINGYDRKLHKSVGEFPISHYAENTMHSKQLFSLEEWDEQAAKNRRLLAERYWEQVHVIVPVYKRYERLKKVLEDLYHQQYWKLKVYIVADGHDEKVQKIVENTKLAWEARSDKNLHPELEYSFLDPPDNHYGDGQRIEILNRLESSDKEWVCFLDSDNTVKPDWILKLWQATFLKDVGGAWSQIYYSENDRNMPLGEFQKKPVFGQFDTLNMMVRLDIAKRHAAVWHRDPIGNDYNFAIECLSEKPWTFVDEVLGSHGQPVSLMVLAVCRNEERIIPFFLRHYEQFADKIVVFDGGSTDKSLELLEAHPKVEVISVPAEKMNNRDLTDIRNEAWKERRHDYDWVIVCDMDEFVYHPKMKEKLFEFRLKEITIPAIKGYQMVDEVFPHGFKGQLYEIVRNGYHDKEWLNKFSIFNPAKVDINYEVGCHQAKPTGKIKTSEEFLYLLHFKYVGYKEFIERNEKLATRLSETDLKNGWAFHYGRDAQMTIEQFRQLIKKSSLVLSQPLNLRTDLKEQDPWVFEEVITKNQYKVSKEDFIGKNVIDIGAHNGLFSLLARENKAETIIAVEPQPATVKLLQANVTNNDIIVVPLAIGLRDDEYVQMVMRPEFNETDGRLYSQPSTTGIKTITLDSLIKLIPNNKPILLKVDAEGAEYDLFYGASIETLNKIQTICIEMHEDIFRFEKQKGLIDKLRNFITAMGFSEIFMENYVGDKVRLLRYDRATKGILLKQQKEVTVGIPTKNRYFSTLPTTLLSVMMQTYPIKKLILVDDSDPKEDGKMTDLREDPMYQYLFSMMSKKGIEWEVVFGQHKGQHISHQIIMDKAKTEFVWRLDDDEYAEPNVLEELVKQMQDGVGVVGGLVLDPKMSQLAPPNYVNTNRMADINTRENTQWMKQPEGQVFEVEHLYSSFLYRKVEDIKFCLELSPAAHREETIFSHEYVRKGWKALVTTSAVTWHFRNPSGGIRSHGNPEFWAGDEKIFQRKLASWQVDMEGKKMIVLDSGIGDAICFKEIVPDLLKKYPKLIIGTYYSLLFKDLPVETMHPWQAKDIIGDKIADSQNIYRYLWQESDKGRKIHLIQAYKELFLGEKE